jgi:hypothetical protein
MVLRRMQNENLIEEIKALGLWTGLVTMSWTGVLLS